MKAVILIAVFLLVVLVGCKEGADGGLPSYSPAAFDQITKEVDKKMAKKFKMASKQLFNDKDIKKVLPNGSAFRQDIPTNNLGRNYELDNMGGQGLGRNYLLDYTLSVNGTKFCSLDPNSQAKRLIEVAVDIQNTLNLLEIAMRIEDYITIQKHFEELNNIPLEVTKQLMIEVATSGDRSPANGGNSSSSSTSTTKTTTTTGNQPLDNDGSGLNTGSAGNSGAAGTNENAAQGQTNTGGSAAPANGQLDVKVGANGGVSAAVLKSPQQKTAQQFSGMVNGEIVLPEGAKAPLAKIAEKYQRLIALRNQVKNTHIRQSTNDALRAQKALKDAEDSYNNSKFNREVKQAVKELSKVFPKSKFLKKNSYVFLDTLTISKKSLGVSKRQLKDGEIDRKEIKQVIKKEDKARKQFAKESAKDKAALESFVDYEILGYGDLNAQLQDLEDTMAKLLTESANFTTLDNARYFLENHPFEIVAKVNAAVEDSAWSINGLSGKPSYQIGHAMLAEIAGDYKSSIGVTAHDIYQALKNNIDTLDLGKKQKAVKSALAYFDTVADFQKFGGVAGLGDSNTYEFYRKQVLDREKEIDFYMRSNDFVSPFSPMREWKKIMCPAIGAKHDCSIVDLYRAVGRNPDQAQDLANQIRYLLGMKNKDSLKNRYFALVKALNDLKDIGSNMDKTCVGQQEELITIKTDREKFIDTYIYSQRTYKEIWDKTVQFDVSINQDLRSYQGKGPDGLNFSKEKEVVPAAAEKKE